MRQGLYSPDLHLHRDIFLLHDRVAFRIDTSGREGNRNYPGVNGTLETPSPGIVRLKTSKSLRNSSNNTPVQASQPRDTVFASDSQFHGPTPQERKSTMNRNERVSSIRYNEMPTYVPVQQPPVMALPQQSGYFNRPQEIEVQHRNTYNTGSRSFSNLRNFSQNESADTPGEVFYEEEVRPGPDGDSEIIVKRKTIRKNPSSVIEVEVARPATSCDHRALEVNADRLQYMIDNIQELLNTFRYPHYNGIPDQTHSEIVQARPIRAVSHTNLHGAAPTRITNTWTSSDPNIRGTLRVANQYSAHRENLKRQQEARMQEQWSSRNVNEMGGTEVMEELETITLQPIGRGVQNLESSAVVGTINRSSRTPTLPNFRKQLYGSQSYRKPNPTMQSRRNFYTLANNRPASRANWTPQTMRRVNAMGSMGQIAEFSNSNNYARTAPLVRSYSVRGITSNSYHQQMLPGSRNSFATYQPRANILDDLTIPDGYGSHRRQQIIPVIGPDYDDPMPYEEQTYCQRCSLHASNNSIHSQRFGVQETNIDELCEKDENASTLIPELSYDSEEAVISPVEAHKALSRPYRSSSGSDLYHRFYSVHQYRNHHTVVL
ncbi:Tensin 1 [Cichlidogyrus casuarinus]|uniref:Tensin 1 n=1 Tax=Cichlidogyrus casuarinus TaxID=1844966 RepID=A0ABD2QKK5_9PLAT